MRLNGRGRKMKQRNLKKEKEEGLKKKRKRNDKLNACPREMRSLKQLS